MIAPHRAVDVSTEPASIDDAASKFRTVSRLKSATSTTFSYVKLSRSGSVLS